jgi:predicted enzyme related to lactoylglutathione lyase
MPCRLAAYTSYTAQRFETTRHFYESILAGGDTRAPGAEEFPPEVPLASGVSIVIVVEDLRTHRADVVGRGGEAGPVAAEDGGTYFGLADPDGVPVYFVERASP